MVLRAVVRGAVERILGGRFARHRIARHYQHRTLVLAFHNIVPDDFRGGGDRSLHMPLGSFMRLITVLSEVCAATSLQDALAGAGGIGPRFVVTFDDAYRGAVAIAIPELARIGVPATVFVPTGMLGDRDFWWDALADPGKGLPAGHRSHVLEQLAGDDILARQWAKQSGIPTLELPDFCRTVTESELMLAAQTPGVTLAPHSRTHRSLDRLSGADLMSELTEPLSWFSERSIPFVNSLAYPYGHSAPAVEEAAASAGYSSAWLVSGGWLAANELVGGRRRHALPRLNIPAGASAANAMMRIASLLGVR